MTKAKAVKMGQEVKHKEDMGSTRALELKQKVAVLAWVTPSHTELIGLADSNL